MKQYPYFYQPQEIANRVLALQSNCPQLSAMLGEKNLSAIVTHRLYSLHDYAFDNLKQRIHKIMSSDDYDFSKESIKSIIEELEKEYSDKDECLKMIGIEPDIAIDAFAEGQVRWLNEHFQFHN